jgi:hypothetical protein
MKSNPFYALSASAMLLGCWLLSQALELQAGRLTGLLVLMAVLQLYEGLLVGLGAFLVRSGRAPRDGLTVLMLESVFLMDVTLLVAECVTADANVGTAVAAASGALAVAKLAWVRRAAPGLLSRSAAVLLGAQAGLVLAAPVMAVHLARARLFTAVALYGFWWATPVLPVAQQILRGETGWTVGTAPRARQVWTWAPSAMALLHLWAVGYIHALDFRPAFLAPFLLGLAVTAPRAQVVRQVALPAVAAVCSLGQGAALGFRLFAADGPVVSPLRLALLGVALTWGYLAWRDHERWLAVLAIGGGAAGLVGSSVPRAIDDLARLLASLLPRDSFGWGALTVIAAFVLLAAGARRSVALDPRRPSGAGPDTGPPPRRGREVAAMALVLGVFAHSSMAAAFEAFPFGHPRQRGTAALVAAAAAVAFFTGARAHGRASREEADPAGRRLAGLAMLSGAAGFVLTLAPLSAGDVPRHLTFRAESAAIGEMRTLLAAAREDRPEAPFEKHGYRFTLKAAPSGSFAYLAVPMKPGESGVRAFCGDSRGLVCFAADGKAPRTARDGQCDLATCTVLR